MTTSAILNTLVSTGGAVLAGLGGVALTHRGTFRREAEQAERAGREMRDQNRRNCQSELVGAATRLRTLVEVACQRHWRDMDMRIIAIQNQAIEVGVAASKVALICSAEESTAARALSVAAGELAAYVAKHTVMGYEEGKDKATSGGQMTHQPEFTEFDARLDQFYAVTADRPEVPEDPTLPTPRYRAWFSSRSSRRPTSSR